MPTPSRQKPGIGTGDAICVRRLKVSTELTAYLSAHWPSLAQVGQLRRTITTKGQTRHEVVYLLTSLSPAEALPLRLLDLVRGHWSIEIV